jgi:hypothetical protein
MFGRPPAPPSTASAPTLASKPPGGHSRRALSRYLTGLPMGATSSVSSLQLTALRSFSPPAAQPTWCGLRHALSSEAVTAELGEARNIPKRTPYSKLYCMDEGNIKTPIPKARHYWCFCLGWCSIFVGSGCGQKQSFKLLQNMVYNTTQNPPPPAATHCLYILYVYFGKGEVREKGRGVENTNLTDCISSLYTP